MAVAAGAVSVVGGIAQGVIGARQAKKANDAIKNYKRQEFQNVYKDLTVSTKGAELQREELARISATSVDALRSGGVRGVIGGVGAVQQSNVSQSRSIGADLDMQQKNIDQLRASDEARIRDMQERREEGDLAGLGQQLAAGQQNLMTGIGTAAAGVGAAAGLGGGQQAAEGNPLQTATPTISAGLANQAPQVPNYAQGLAQAGMQARGYQLLGYQGPSTPPVYTGN